MYFIFGTTIHMNMLSQWAITNVTPILLIDYKHSGNNFHPPTVTFSLCSLYSVFLWNMLQYFQFVPSSLIQRYKRNFLEILHQQVNQS
jgi:hypothetical protein